MRLRYMNVTTDEPDVMICFPNLLSNDSMVGMWVGIDFDKRWCSGPIVFSQQHLEVAQLARLVREQRIIGSAEIKKAKSLLVGNPHEALGGDKDNSLEE